MNGKSREDKVVAAGDVIMERDPWVWVFQWDSYKEYCAGCFHPLSLRSPDVLPCLGCQIHRYCSQRCQTADWKLEHQSECTLMKRITDYRQQAARKPDDSFFVATILTLKIHNKMQKSVMDRFPGLNGKRSAKEILMSFDTNLFLKGKKITEFLRKPFYQGLLAAVYPKAADRPAEMDLEDIQLRVMKNMFPLADYNSEGKGPSIYGSALFLGIGDNDGTLVCLDYNAMVVFPGKTMRVVALDDIPGYSGLTDIKWCDSMSFEFLLPAKQRREYFQRKHRRVCGCRKCTPEYDAEINPLKCITNYCPERIPSDERALLPCPQCGAINEPRLRALRRFMKKHEPVFQLALTADLTDHDTLPGLVMHMKAYLIEELNKLDILHPGALLRMVCGWIVTDVYEEQNRFEEAWALYQDCMLCIRHIFPKYHVIRAQFLGFAGDFAVKWVHRMMNYPRGVSKLTASLITEVLGHGIEYLQESSEINLKLFGQLCKFAMCMELKIREAKDVLRAVKYAND
ncbi:uncharacterized protein LOC129601675 [Paramacrobiotus metropolitanus]|uniref:uncharacterized protein LOC129601675 n=1 Tax=Paramacrobiotus metropolitanus TaxID=2943436 RepID=UPI002445F8F4|nr:uncharacterized protein LOC129601675 [Paramacrobiotus metropolitanus]